MMPKIFENIVAYKLSSLFKNVIIDKQHDFILGRSISTNLLVYHDFVNSALEQGSQVYTDFRKAFDIVDQLLLLCKLRAYGIEEVLFDWIFRVSS